jgi:multidrug efflux pump subunit AcrA (membrane-fusion protein)
VLALGCPPAPQGAVVASAPSTPVRRGDFRHELLLSGELRAVRSIEIKAPQTTLFQLRIQFMAEEGSTVRKGDPLLDFDNSGLAEQMQELESRILDAEMQIVSERNALASAMKDLEIELAEREFDHEQALLAASIDPEVLSRKEYGERKLALESAAERLAQARDKIELTRSRGAAQLDVTSINRDKLKQDLLLAREGVALLSIKAPADGLVVYERRRGTTLRHQEGDNCWPGQAVMELPDLSEMQVEFLVSEVDAPLLTAGMSVTIRLDSFPDRALSGTIAHVPSMAVKLDDDSKLAVFKVPATLDETWPDLMKPGMSARGRVVIEERRDVPLVAREAVRFESGSYVVRIPGADGAPDRLERITPIARDERDYVISDDDWARLAVQPAEPGERRAAVGSSS